MKLLELEIRGIRGIRELLLKPEGKSFVIWGPNGAGKSAVVDSIDFLFTGQISRLSGRGTGKISLSKHGRHIDAVPEEAYVRAQVLLNNSSTPLELRRWIARPDVLDCNDQALSDIGPVLELAARGQMVLTRRDILKFITAESGTRAQEIQHLLNLHDVEAIRTSLVKATNICKKDLKTSEATRKQSRDRVCQMIGLQRFQADKVLKAVNAYRKTLGGAPISSLRHEDFKSKLNPPNSTADDQTQKQSSLINEINAINHLMIDAQSTFTDINTKLRHLISGLNSNPNGRQELSKQELLRMGLSMLDESGECPLCLHDWPPGELGRVLNERLAAADDLDKAQKELIKYCLQLKQLMDNWRSTITKFIETLPPDDLNAYGKRFRSWVDQLNTFSSRLAPPYTFYEGLSCNEEIKNLFAPDWFLPLITKLSTITTSINNNVNPEQSAWDTLTRLEEVFQRLAQEDQAYESASLAFRRATLLQDEFQASRDAVLSALYDSISDRFVQLYRTLHGTDETSFVASMSPDGPGLNFEVDFHGRGQHPPHALHSEGHQDSMGLCLYLALSEHLRGGLMNLIILDDVMMSVDVDHRRELSRLLASLYGDYQLLITTHDRTWARQLLFEQVVAPQLSYEFFSWDIATGPSISDGVDVWRRIDEDIRIGDIPTAAARLRRTSEELFSHICDALGARIRFKLSGRWDLGDLLPEAYAQYLHLLKKAKAAANSWNKTELVDQLKEIHSTAEQIYARSKAESWGINMSLHYNNWLNLSATDFQPIVDAFTDLIALFRCSECKINLQLSRSQGGLETVTCQCGSVNWSLNEKKTKKDTGHRRSNLSS